MPDARQQAGDAAEPAQQKKTTAATKKSAMKGAK
jgi:hypothetical protein